MLFRSTSIKILEFFLARLDEKLFVHFEVIPDHLPDALKAVIQKFPPERLQFEIGIQTWNPEVQALISRRQDNEKSAANIAWLRQHSNAHLHVDLIVGLPGEDMESFGAGFDRLVALNPPDIQVGILKRLRGTPIARHTDVSKCRLEYRVGSAQRADQNLRQNFPYLRRANRRLDPHANEHWNVDAARRYSQQIFRCLGDG